MGNLLARPADSLTRNDIVIVVVGPSGAGKSSFINKATDDTILEVGKGLEPCTKRIAQIRCNHPQDPKMKVVFVDTPAYNADTTSIADIERDVRRWLVETRRQASVAGIIYLHKISDDRLAERLRDHLKLFSGLTQNVTLATTMWDKQKISSDKKLMRQSELETHWGSEVLTHDNTIESAWKVVQKLLDQRPVQ